jgi:hypothetical protein
LRKTWNLKFVNRVIKTIMVCPCIKNGQKKNTEKGIKITIYRKETNEVNQSKTVQPGTGKHQEEKRKIKRLETFCLSSYIKWK